MYSLGGSAIIKRIVERRGDGGRYAGGAGIPDVEDTQYDIQMFDSAGIRGFGKLYRLELERHEGECRQSIGKGDGRTAIRHGIFSQTVNRAGHGIF